MVVARLTENDDGITPLIKRCPRLGLALGPALVRACSTLSLTCCRCSCKKSKTSNNTQKANHTTTHIKREKFKCKSHGNMYKRKN